MSNPPVSTASTMWFDDKGKPHIRVFSCDGQTVTEQRFAEDTGWTIGQTFPGVQASACCARQKDSWVVRLYIINASQTSEWSQYPDEDGGTWTRGSYRQP